MGWFLSLSVVTLLFLESLAQQFGTVTEFRAMSIPQSLWTPNQTLIGIPYRIACSTICATRGQYQFVFDQGTSTCQIGTVPLYLNNGTGPLVNLFYKVQVINFTWGSYSNWSACNVTTCGYGSQNQTRTCSGDPCSTAMSAPNCPGENVNFQDCYSGIPCTSTHIPLLSPAGIPTDVSLNPSLSPSYNNLPNYVSGYTLTPSNNVAIIVVDNGVLLCGGYNSVANVIVQSCTFLQFGSSAAVAHSTMNVPRAYCAGVTLKNRSAWILGGGEGFSWSTITNTTEVLNPATKTWSYGPTMPVGLAFHTVVPLDDVNDQYLILGGNSYPSAATNFLVYQYTWSTSTWLGRASCSYAHNAPTAAAAVTSSSGSKMVVVYGGGTNNLEIYSVATNTWTSSTSPFSSGSYFACGYVSQNQFFLYVFPNGNPYHGVMQLSADLTTWTNRTDIPSNYSVGFCAPGYQYCAKNCGLASCPEINTTFGGADFNTSQTGVSSASACKDLCQHMAGCPFYSYNSANSTCYFKMSNTTTTTNTAYTSGPATCGCLEVGMAYSVTSYLNIIATIPDAEMCQWYCIQDVNCYYFTYYTKGYADSTQWMNCYTLGYPAVPAAGAVGVISGVKICP